MPALLRAGLGLPIGIAGLALVALPATSQSDSQAISTPSPGVLCDAMGPVCYDDRGPSIGLTQATYGRDAAERLTRQLSGRPPVNDFRLSNGAVCDTRARLCWSDGFSKGRVAPRLSQHLFGSNATGGGGAGSSTSLTGLTTPQNGVVCDPAGQVCYDRMGLSLGLTREYYGAFAEQSALRNLNGQAPPRQFRLSTGAACDVDARRCWSDGWQRRTLDGPLSQQLFGAEAAGLARQAQCRLTRFFTVLSSGSCEISERRGGSGRSLEVTLKDGTAYTFTRRRGEGYRLTDSKGASWPVRVTDQGTSLSFGWADRVLSVTPQRQQTQSPMSLGQLIDSLLGN